MCESNSIVKNNTISQFFKKRSAIWQLPPQQCCPVIGTCLNVAQLKKLKTRFKDHINEELKTDYDLHSFFVSLTSNKNPISIAINKLLNKQYQHFVSDINKLKTDIEINNVWMQRSQSDLIVLAGYFWAIMTCKYASEKLKNKVYGEVHMISHIAGQENKTELQKLHDEKEATHKVMAKKQRFIDEKNQLLDKQRIEIKHLNQRNSQITFQMNQLQKRKNNNGLTSKDYERLIASQQFKINNLQGKLDSLEDLSMLKPIKQKQQAILLNDISAIIKDKPCDGNCTDCHKTDLCGKKILYVGGFSRHRRKFQQMTRDINGEFFYHDGGKQQSEHILDDMVKKVDCIFCPVDCISHGAIGRIKSLAKTHCKDCVFLRSASLSSFNIGIKQYAS